MQEQRTFKGISCGSQGVGPFTGRFLMLAAQLKSIGSLWRLISMVSQGNQLPWTVKSKSNTERAMVAMEKVNTPVQNHSR